MENSSFSIEHTIIGNIYCSLTCIENEYGPIFSLWEFPHSQDRANNQYATANLGKKGNNLWEFSVETHYVPLRNKGFASFLIKKIADWAFEHNINYIYGYLSGEYKDAGKWENSIPFYGSLAKKENRIKDCYFVSSLKNFPKYTAKEKLSVEELESLGAGYVIIEIG